MTSFVIRAARSEDWPQFYTFQLERDKPLDSLEAAFERYTRHLSSPDKCLQVAEVNGGIVGIAMATVFDEYLMSGRKQIRFSTLEVSPEYRRQGIGRALFGAVRSWAEASGGTWLEWYASASAAPFYERLGFKGDPCPQPEYPYFELEFKR